MNFTLLNLTKHPEITRDCFDWCKEQVLVNQSHFIYEDLYIVIFSLISFLAYGYFFNNKNKIMELFKGNKQYYDISLRFFFDLGRILLIVFLIIVIWFR